MRGTPRYGICVLKWRVQRMIDRCGRRVCCRYWRVLCPCSDCAEGKVTGVQCAGASWLPLGTCRGCNLRRALNRRSRGHHGAGLAWSCKMGIRIRAHYSPEICRPSESILRAVPLEYLTLEMKAHPRDVFQTSRLPLGTTDPSRH